MRRHSPVSLTSSITRFSMLALVFVTLLTSTLSSLTSAAEHPILQDAPTIQPRATKPFLLRIMPLGASITVGFRSTDKNGYRKVLREQLRYAGWEVDMVGSLKNGTMKDRDNEGHFGYTIDEVATAAKKSVSLQPNVILINVGTNDAVRNNRIRDAGSRIDSLITELTSAISNTTIILSTLIPNTRQPAAVAQVNQEYRDVAARRRARGDRVILAEMSYFVQSANIVDGTHPNDEGYKEMASVWWAAIQQAEEEGMLDSPNPVARSAIALLTGSGGKEGQGLDDGPVKDPGLPAYSAPAQPVESTGGAVRWLDGYQRGLLWAVAVQVVVVVLAGWMR